jgi:hypothetical protein
MIDVMGRLNRSQKWRSDDAGDALAPQAQAELARLFHPIRRQRRIIRLVCRCGPGGIDEVLPIAVSGQEDSA